MVSLSGPASSRSAVADAQNARPSLVAGAITDVSPCSASFSTKQRCQSRRLALSLDRETSLALNACARQHHLTLSALFLSLFTLTIGEGLAQPALRINVPTFFRDPDFPQVEQLVGDLRICCCSAAKSARRYPCCTTHERRWSSFMNGSHTATILVSALCATCRDSTVACNTRRSFYGWLRYSRRRAVLRTRPRTARYIELGDITRPTGRAGRAGRLVWRRDFDQLGRAGRRL